MKQMVFEQQHTCGYLQNMKKCSWTMVNGDRTRVQRWAGPTLPNLVHKGKKLGFLIDFSSKNNLTVHWRLRFSFYLYSVFNHLRLGSLVLHFHLVWSLGF